MSKRQQLREQREALTSLQEPNEEECILRVKKVRGGNLYDLVDRVGKEALYMLPKAQRNVVWIRPGSYVIAYRYEEPRGKVHGEVRRALLEKHEQYLRKHARWSSSFALVEGSATSLDNADDVDANPNRKRWADFAGGFDDGNNDRDRHESSSGEEVASADEGDDDHDFEEGSNDENDTQSGIYNADHVR